MTEIDARLVREPLFVALCEGLRWWISFDGPQMCLLRKDPNHHLSVSDVRRIALTYNFARNLSSQTGHIQIVADRVNQLAGKSWTTLAERAMHIESAIDDIKRVGGTNFRLVSGTTKLTWFVSPKNWTPFDRLAALGVGAKHTDTVARMRLYYEILDALSFLRTARAIDARLRDTELADVGGARILDKFLMMRGDSDWTDNAHPMAIAFAESLPQSLRTALVDAGRSLLDDDACKLDFGAQK